MSVLRIYTSVVYLLHDCAQPPFMWYEVVYAATSNLAFESGMFMSGLLSCALFPGLRVSFHLWRDMFTISTVDTVWLHSPQYIIPPWTSLHSLGVFLVESNVGPYLWICCWQCHFSISHFHSCQHTCEWCVDQTRNLHILHRWCVWEMCYVRRFLCWCLCETRNPCSPRSKSISLNIE